MHLLVGTAVTRPEMAFALEHGQSALLTRLLESPDEQISVLARDSIV